MKLARRVIGGVFALFVSTSTLSAQVQEIEPDIYDCGYTYAVEITGVTKSGNPNRAELGDTLRVSAVTYRYGPPSSCYGITESVYWSSSNESIADLRATPAVQGVYVIRGSGAVTLRATGYSSSPPAPYSEITLNIQLEASRPPCYDGTWRDC